LLHWFEVASLPKRDEFKMKEMKRIRNESCIYHALCVVSMHYLLCHSLSPPLPDIIVPIIVLVFRPSARRPPARRPPAIRPLGPHGPIGPMGHDPHGALWDNQFGPGAPQAHETTIMAGTIIPAIRVAPWLIIWPNRSKKHTQNK